MTNATTAASVTSQTAPTTWLGLGLSPMATTLASTAVIGLGVLLGTQDSLHEPTGDPASYAVAATAVEASSQTEDANTEATASVMQASPSVEVVDTVEVVEVVEVIAAAEAPEVLVSSAVATPSAPAAPIVAAPGKQRRAARARKRSSANPVVVSNRGNSDLIARNLAASKQVSRATLGDDVTPSIGQRATQMAANNFGAAQHKVASNVDALMANLDEYKPRQTAKARSGKAGNAWAAKRKRTRYRAAAEKAIRGHRGGIKACFRSLVQLDPSVRGHFVLDFRIAANGAARVKVTSKDLTDASFLACVRRVGNRVTFPRSEGPTRIRYPMHMKARR